MLPFPWKPFRRGHALGVQSNWPGPVPLSLFCLFAGFVCGAVMSATLQNADAARPDADNTGTTFIQQQQQQAVVPPESPVTPHCTPAAPPEKMCELPSQCRALYYAAEDPVTASGAFIPSGPPSVQSLAMTAWQLTDLEFELSENGTATKFSVPGSCFMGYNRNETLAMKKVTSSLVAQLQPRSDRQSCKTLDENYIIISDTLGRAAQNVYDELSTVWYHFWLIRRATCGSATPLAGSNWRVTHLNDILNDQPPLFKRRWEFIARTADAGVSFPGVLGVLGKYVPWAEVVKEAKGCVRMRRAVTIGSSWLWLERPLPAQASPPLQEFVETVLAELGLGGPRKGRCRHTLLYATRRASTARRVLNEEAMLHAMRVALPDFTVKDVDLGTLPFKKQVEAVRGADVYVFPHGGAGPNVLWLPHGAVVIELFPHADADPMYRNLAVQTGKSYLSWQAAGFSTPFNRKTGAERYHFSEASDFEVDVRALRRLVTGAAATVRNTVGTNWFVSSVTSSRPYSAFLCPSCGWDLDNPTSPDDVFSC